MRVWNITSYLVEEIYGGTLSAPQYRPRLVPKCAPGYEVSYFWC